MASQYGQVSPVAALRWIPAVNLGVAQRKRATTFGEARDFVVSSSKNCNSSSAVSNWCGADKRLLFEFGAQASLRQNIFGHLHHIRSWGWPARCVAYYHWSGSLFGASLARIWLACFHCHFVSTAIRVGMDADGEWLLINKWTNERRRIRIRREAIQTNIYFCHAIHHIGAHESAHK